MYWVNVIINLDHLSSFDKVGVNNSKYGFIYVICKFKPPAHRKHTASNPLMSFK